MPHVVVTGTIPAFPAGATSEVLSTGETLVTGPSYQDLAEWADTNRKTMTKVSWGEGDHEYAPVVVTENEAKVLRDLRELPSTATVAQFRAIRSAAIAAKGG